jgi:Mg2+ and Co2+ transporter CorA
MFDTKPLVVPNLPDPNVINVDMEELKKRYFNIVTRDTQQFTEEEMQELCKHFGIDPDFTIDKILL